MSLLLQILVFVSAVLILFDAVGAVNRMNHRTDHLMRIAYLLIACGSFGQLMSIFAGHVPSLPEASFMVGIGMMTLCERRVFHCPILKSREDCQ